MSGSNPACTWAYSAGQPARTVRPQFDAARDKVAKSLQLLTYKPVMYVCNVDDLILPGRGYAELAETETGAAGRHPAVVAAQVLAGR